MKRACVGVVLAATLAASGSAPAAFAQSTSARSGSALSGSALGGDIDPWLWGDTAVLRGLDKVTAETRDFEAPVGEDVRFFALTINVKKCAKRPPEETPETIVGMEIFDRATDGSGAEIAPELIFSGWMFGSSPALNPLEHPVYDVWAIDCTGGAADGPPADGEAEAAAESGAIAPESRPRVGEIPPSDD